MTKMVSDQGPLLNMDSVVILIAASNVGEVDLLGQIFLGFGARKCPKCTTAAEAQKAIRDGQFDLMVIDGALSDQSGLDLIRWIRSTESRSRFSPVILLMGHTRRSQVLKARDCGANFVLAKPIVSRVLFQRIAWLSRDARPIVETASYIGPDRRFKKLGPPGGQAGRRADDLSPELGEAQAPNMSQDDIDSLVSPQRAMIG